MWERRSCGEMASGGAEEGSSVAGLPAGFELGADKIWL